MPKVNFYLNPRPDKHGRHSILLYVRGTPKGNKTPIILTTDESIPPEKWDRKKQEAKPNYIGNTELNRLLKKYKDDAESCIRTTLVKFSRDEDKDVVFQACKTALQEHFAPKKRADFTAIFEEFIEVNSLNWSLPTLKKFRTLRTYLHEFSEKERFSLSFSTIDDTFHSQFQRYLLNRQPPLHNNAVNKMLRMVKEFMRWSLLRGYHTNIKYQNFKSLKSDEVEVVALTKQEVERLQAYDFSDRPAFERVRDCFLFQIAVGQRYSDASRFRHDAVHDDCWSFKVEKTGRTLKIPLLPMALHIIEKYKDLGHLPFLSNQKMNQALKEICKIVGLDRRIERTRSSGNKQIRETLPLFEVVGTHTARRTFVSLAIAYGIEATIIQKVTGHKTLSMMLRYLDVTSETTKKALEEAWK